MRCVVDVLACACKVNELRSLNQLFEPLAWAFLSGILNRLYVVIGGGFDGFDPVASSALKFSTHDWAI